MQEGISTRARIAILIYSMTNAVLFGIGKYFAHSEVLHLP